MGAAATDLAMALDRVAFARALGMEKPDPWQRALLRSDAPRVLLNIARQLGKSTTTALLALHRALYRPGSLILILAPAERQARETFAKIAAFYKTLGHANYATPDSDRKLGLELANRSRIEALPGTEKTVRGFSGVDLLIVDEAARVDDELYFAIRPMLAVSGGSLLMLSTPAGKRGVFFEEWMNGGHSWERYEVRELTGPPHTDPGDLPYLSETNSANSRSAPSSVSRARKRSSGSFVLPNGRVAGRHRKEAERRQVAPVFPAHRRGPGYRTRDNRADQQLVATLRIQRVGIYDQLSPP